MTRLSRNSWGVSGQGSLGTFAQACKRCWGGWKTFVSATLPVTVEYLPDWSVWEEATGVTFTSAQGATIHLMRIETGVLSAEDFWQERWLPHTRCSTHTNAYGICVYLVS
jgi:hypothetical protein